jgi:hypothetical protein
VLCCVVVAVVINAAKQSNVMRCSAMGCGAMECNQYACLGRIKEHLHFVVLCCVVLCWIGLGCGEADDHLIVGGLLPTPLIVDHYGAACGKLGNRLFRPGHAFIQLAWNHRIGTGSWRVGRQGEEAGGGVLWCAMVCYGVLWCAMVCYGVLCMLRVPHPNLKSQASSLKPQIKQPVGKGFVPRQRLRVPGAAKRVGV